MPRHGFHHDHPHVLLLTESEEILGAIAIDLFRPFGQGHIVVRLEDEVQSIGFNQLTVLGWDVATLADETDFPLFLEFERRLVERFAEAPMAEVAVDHVGLKPFQALFATGNYLRDIFTKTGGCEDGHFLAATFQ